MTLIRRLLSDSIPVPGSIWTESKAAMTSQEAAVQTEAQPAEEVGRANSASSAVSCPPWTGLR